ncbi:MAG: carboxylesterase family protein [Psychromonas sp.]
MKRKKIKNCIVGMITLLSMTFTTAYAAQDNTIIVDSQLGKVQGVLNEGVMAFYGVPYAQNPFVEGRRFQAPQAIQAWDGVLDCTTLTPPVPQPSRGRSITLVGAAGDLTVNIWAPISALKTSEKLPVMVWIPGGAFIREDASQSVYQGESFAKQGVIVVTINYRVGVDGFMHLAGAPDNRGILDQILALQWVHHNIVDFGGDAQQVTLFGQSAGAESVAILLGTDKTKGLFQKVIMQSPPMQVLTRKEAEQLADAFAKQLAVSASLEGIASVSYPKLVAAVVELGHTITDREQWGKLSWGGTAFLPVVDNNIIHKTAVLDLANADPSIPVIVGSTDQEARLYLVPGGQLQRIKAEKVSLFLKDLALSGKPTDVYRQTDQGQSAGDIYADLSSDYTFRMPALHIAEKLVSNGNPVWHYNFSWQSPTFGAAHFIDVPFTFNTTQTAEAKRLIGSHAPQSLANAMHRQWTDFAKTGKADWPQYQLNKRATMRFDTQSHVVDDAEKKVRLLWTDYVF